MINQSTKVSVNNQYTNIVKKKKKKKNIGQFIG